MRYVTQSLRWTDDQVVPCGVLSATNRELFAPLRDCLINGYGGWMCDGRHID